MVIDIGKILMLTLDEILNLKKNVNIKFEDGVIINNASYKHVIIFRYLMEVRRDIEFPVVSELWVSNYLVNGLFTNGSYLGVYSRLFRLLAKSSKDIISNELKLRLFKSMYETINTVNRKLVTHFSEYCLGSEIQDMLEIQFEPELMEAIHLASENNSKAAIENSYEVLDKVIKNKKFDDNPMQLFYLSRTVSIGQIRQLLACRGYVTEMDSKIFNIPMTNSFVLGFKNIYEAAIESRAGAKAMYLSSKAIQDAEYMARELQLATMPIENVYRGDCGKPTYVDFYVRSLEVDEKGDVVTKGDLKNIIGKRYLDTDGIEKIIDGSEKHLENTYIKLRMAVYCGHPDKHSICSACIGEIADSILDHQNLGHISSTTGSTGMSQALLSTKHLLISASSASIKLDPAVSKYMLIRNNEKLIFKAGVLNKKTKRVYLKFKQREAWGLDNVMNVTDIFSINISKISRLSSAILVFESKKETVEIELPLKYSSRRAFFSIEMLSHIMVNGYETLDEEYYMVDINDLLPKTPIFMYEKVEFDFSALIKEFKSLLKTRKYKKVEDKYKSEYMPHVLVQNLFELINNKLDVNIALLEVLTYAFTVQDLTNRNFDLGRNTLNKDVVGFREVIDYRSAGASYNWDDLQNKVLNPILHMRENKCSHPMDVFFCPNEAIADIEHK
jgi:hypothetical protein